MIIKTRRLLVLIGLIFLLPLSVGLVLLQTRLGSRAAGGEARLSFVPGSELVVRADTGLTKTGFVKVEWTFDPTKIRLASEITTSTALKTVVQKSAAAEANANGKVVVVLGLAPSDISLAPSANFEIARMQIETVSTTPNDSAPLTFTSASLQVVDDEGTAMTVLPTDGRYDLNVTPTVTTGPSLPTDPTATPTTSVEPTVIVEPTAISTVTPEPTAVPTAVPTNTPTPTRVPTATPTRVPIVTPSQVPNLPTLVPTATLMPTIVPTSTIVPTPTRVPGGKNCIQGDVTTVFGDYQKTRDLRALFSDLYILATKGKCR